MAKKIKFCEIRQFDFIKTLFMETQIIFYFGQISTLILGIKCDLFKDQKILVNHTSFQVGFVTNSVHLV